MSERESNTSIQPVLPGLDIIKGGLDAYLETTRKTEAKNAKWHGEKAIIHTLQDEVWEDYCRDVLRPRQTIWQETVSLLSSVKPTEIRNDILHYNDATYRRPAAQWAFSGITTRDGQSVRLTAEFEITTDHFTVSKPLKDAIDFLTYGRTRDSKRPQELLGVVALGKWRKQIPEDELRHRAAEAVATNVDGFKAIVKADMLGMDKPKIVCGIEDKDFGDSMDESGRDFYCEYENAQYVRDGVKATGQDAASVEAIGNYLRQTLLRLNESDIERNFQTLSSINLLIDDQLLPDLGEPSGAKSINQVNGC